MIVGHLAFSYLCLNAECGPRIEKLSLAYAQVWVKKESGLFRVFRAWKGKRPPKEPPVSPSHIK